MKKAIVVLFVLLLAALLVTACGGGNTAPAAPTSAPAAPTAAPLPAGDVAKGTELYNQVCVACHGPGGIGVQGLGKDMTTSTFIAGLSDAELLEFVKKGRSVSDPLNTTGVDMPPKGGNPALTDEQLIDIIAYIRTLHE